jgi:trehalose-phosphatase
MQILNPEKNLSGFFSHLEKSASSALLLDYDGTLAPFTAERDHAVPYPGVVDVLEDIIRNTHTRLVLITGRGVDDLIRLIALRPLPEIWGSHGGERRRTDGSHQRLPVPEKTRAALALANEWIEGMGWSGQVEKKPLSTAVHWRGITAERTQEIRTKVVEHLPNLIDGTGLSLYEFDGGIEVRPPEITKAGAVETILAETPGQAVAYLGDDMTDEDAFAALRGQGLGVLVRDTLRQTKADLWLRPPKELLDFLRQWKQAVSSGPVQAP